MNESFSGLTAILAGSKYLLSADLTLSFDFVHQRLRSSFRNIWLSSRQKVVSGIFLFISLVLKQEVVVFVILAV